MRLFWDPDGCRHLGFKVNVFLNIGSWQHWGWFGGRGSPRREENRTICQDLLRHLGMGQRVRGDCRRCPGTEAGALNLEGWRERWRFVVHLLGSPVRVSYGAGFKQWVEGERLGGDLCDWIHWREGQGSGGCRAEDETGGLVRSRGRGEALQTAYLLPWPECFYFHLCPEVWTAWSENTLLPWVVVNAETHNHFKWNKLLWVLICRQVICIHLLLTEISGNIQEEQTGKKCMSLNTERSSVECSIR